MAGAAMLQLLYPRVAVLGWIVAIAAATHLLIVAGELALTHGTAHARLATHEMTRGAFRGWFVTSVVLAIAALAAPWVPVAPAVAALIAVAAHDHAHVQAGQAVPLA